MLYRLEIIAVLYMITTVLPPAGAQVTAGTCTNAWVEYLGMTRQETGSLQIGYTTEAACRARCEELTTCVSYDFDPPAIFGCSVYEDNLADRLDDHPTINHYQLEVTCVLQDAEQTTCTYKYIGEYTFVDTSIAVPAETVDEDTCLRACTQDANCLSAAVLAGDAMPCTLSGDPLVYDNSRTTDPGRKQYKQIQCTRQDTTTAAPTTAAPTTDSTTDLCEPTMRENCYFVAVMSPCSKSCGKGVMTVQFLCGGQAQNFTGDCCLDVCSNEDAPTGGGGEGGVQGTQPSTLCRDTFPMCMSAAKAHALRKRDYIGKGIVDALLCHGDDSASQPRCRCPTHKSCEGCVTDSDCKWEVEGEYCLTQNWPTLPFFEETVSGNGSCPCDKCAAWENSPEEQDLRWLSELNQNIPCPCRASTTNIIMINKYGLSFNLASWTLYPEKRPADDWNADIMCYNNGYLACEKYHPGANGCLRSANTLASGAGQQCCYDVSGDLIGPDQSGAGTPDKSAVTHSWNPFVVMRHRKHDVIPYKWCCGQCKEAGSCERYEIRRRGSNSHCLP